MHAGPAFSPVALRAYLSSRRRLQCLGKVGHKETGGSWEGRTEIPMSERFIGQVSRSKVGTERECDCIAVHGSTIILRSCADVRPRVVQSEQQESARKVNTGYQ